MDKWKIRASEYLLKTPYMNVRRDQCELPDQSVIDDFYVVEEGNFASVFALTAAHEVVLVRQYKHGTGQVVLELPAGYLEADEDPVEGARREFLEETGYDAPQFEQVAAFIQHPTRMTNEGYLVVATGAHPVGAQRLDANESIEVLLMPVDQVFDQIHSGEIAAVGTVAGIFFGWRYLQRSGRVS